VRECEKSGKGTENGAPTRQRQQKSPVITLVISRQQGKVWFFLDILSNINISITNTIFQCIFPSSLLKKLEYYWKMFVSFKPLECLLREREAYCQNENKTAFSWGSFR